MTLVICYKLGAQGLGKALDGGLTHCTTLHAVQCHSGLSKTMYRFLGPDFNAEFELVHLS